jgi:hypothetical protein
MRMKVLAWFGCGFGVTMLMAAGIDAASAQGYARRGVRAPATGYVVAESRFGNGVVRGAVRQTSLGPQVQLLGGSWIYCKRSCSETLRAETVDFWEAKQGPGGQEQGLFIYFGRW